MLLEEESITLIMLAEESITVIMSNYPDEVLYGTKAEIILTA